MKSDKVPMALKRKGGRGHPLEFIERAQMQTLQTRTIH